ncbi:MAG: exosortase K [Deltaproteobacteria bacterium HGW-Deltaproteobacteria-1]|jgi:exosortase K|nr:MAG: exosortase K [Deltaproteobacteria bacterium HGW-Deltaproteobacteria-1]
MKILNQLTARKIAHCLLVLFIAAGLKYAYSRSTSEDLAWILGPTASLVEFLTGEPFMKEKDIGYVSISQRVAIIPGCSGINFMIAAFCMSTLTLIYSTNRKQYPALYILACFVAAYSMTVCTNSLRIILSIHLYRADIYTPLITPEKIHRLAGIAIYFVCLCFLYFGVQKISSSRNHIDAGRQKNKYGYYKSILISCLVPLFWYLLIVLVLPALNQASVKNPSLFREHATYVLLVSFFLFVMMFLLVICYKSLKPKQEPGQDL